MKTTSLILTTSINGKYNQGLYDGFHLLRTKGLINEINYLYSITMEHRMRRYASAEIHYRLDFFILHERQKVS